MHICMRVVQWMDAQAVCSKWCACVCVCLCAPVHSVKYFPVRERYQICMRFLLRLHFVCVDVFVHMRMLFFIM